jgi:FtsZ-interacting cell division protein ZipA
MTDLQLSMIGVGVVLVGGVAIYNIVQERRARKSAEKAFGAGPGDALFDERREPTLGPVPQEEIAAAAPPTSNLIPPTPDSSDLDAGVAPSAQISSRIDTVAVILADDPITREQLEPLLEQMRGHATPVHVEGIVDEQWHPIDESPRQSWRELRVALQLASRAGPVPEEEIEEFNRAVADFSGTIDAVSQREAPSAAAARARELDHFCAEADIEVAVNVIGQFGATFSLARVKALALEKGLSETVDGKLVRHGRDGSIAFSIRRFADDPAHPSTTYTHGLTFALDLPQVADAPFVFGEMVQAAHAIATTLGGQLVDDKKRPLSDAGLATIKRTVEKVCDSMEAHNIPAGSPLAQRLFS